MAVDFAALEETETVADTVPAHWQLRVVCSGNKVDVLVDSAAAARLQCFHGAWKAAFVAAGQGGFGRTGLERLLGSELAAANTMIAANVALDRRNYRPVEVGTGQAS